VIPTSAALVVAAIVAFVIGLFQPESKTWLFISMAFSIVAAVALALGVIQGKRRAATSPMVEHDELDDRVTQTMAAFGQEPGATVEPLDAEPMSPAPLLGSIADDDDEDDDLDLDLDDDDDDLDIAWAPPVKQTDPAPSVKRAAAATGARKPAAKKPAAKKPVAKTAARKTAAKKPAAKKPAVKTAAKKPAAKTAAKKPAAKTAAKKPAAKKPAAKKPAAKTAAKKPAAKKPAAKKPTEG
jgi:outer membrane biosynthesis protein TonB